MLAYRSLPFDTEIDDHLAVFDRKRLIDLTEIVRPIHSEALGAEADG